MQHSFFKYLEYITGHEMKGSWIYIPKIVETLTKARDAYYNSDSPIMSDAEYDLLEDKLRKLDPKNDFFKTVGAPAKTKQGTKIKHNVPMGSLNKVQTFDELKKWYKSLKINPTLIVTEKLDGISIDLRYKDGNFVQAVTRGDGVYGDDITENVNHMKGIVQKIPKNFSGNIRGEIIITKDDFEKHFKGESSPRNSAAGAAKRLDNSKAKYCTVLCYRVMPDKKWSENRNHSTIFSKGNEFNFLDFCKFKTPESYICKNINDVEQVYQKYNSGYRNEIDYEIDGLVVEVNDLDYAQEICTDQLHPEYAVAYKFPHQQAETTLRNIIWQVGKSGRITPVGVFDSVNVAGANISRASLATAGFVNEMDLGKDDTVLISRRNDVIPKIEKVIKHSNKPRFEIPRVCPNCQGTVRVEGEYLVCKNKSCSEQVEGLVLGWLKKIGVLEWGDAIISDLQNDGVVSKISDLYKITRTQLAEYVGDKRSVTMMSELANKMELPLHILVGSLGIEGIGRTNAKAIVDAGYNTLDKMLNADSYDIASIRGMGEVRAENFVNGLQSNLPTIREMLRLGIEIREPQSGNLNGMSFCMTGFRDAELAEEIEKSGGTIKSSVGQGLTYLIQKDRHSMSEKTKKALAYGTKIISQDEAWAIVK